MPEGELIEKGIRERVRRKTFASPTTYFGRNRKVIKELKKLPLPKEPIVHIFGSGGQSEGFHPTEHLEIANVLKGKNYRINIFDIKTENIKSLRAKKIKLAVEDEAKEYLKNFFPEIEKKELGKKTVNLAGKVKAVSVYAMDIPPELLPNRNGPIRAGKQDIVVSAPLEKADLAICINLHQSFLFKSKKDFLEYSKEVRRIQAGEPIRLTINEEQARKLSENLQHAREFGAAALANIVYGLKKGGFLITDLITEFKLNPSSFGLKRERVLEEKPRKGLRGTVGRREISVYTLVNPNKLNAKKAMR